MHVDCIVDTFVVNLVDIDRVFVSLEVHTNIYSEIKKNSCLTSGDPKTDNFH